MAKPATKAGPSGTSITSIAQKLAAIGLRDDWDFVLHLPLRYEDETRLTPLRDALPGQDCQVEVEIVHSEITYRPRRQLVVQARDGETMLHLRFLNFYGSQVKQLVAGKRLRLFGEVRPGFFGAEMVHPRYRIVAPNDPLPEALTPVYSTTAGVSQAAIRKIIGRARSTRWRRRHNLTTVCPPRYAAATTCQTLPTACSPCTAHRRRRHSTASLAAPTRRGGASNLTNCCRNNSP